MRMRGWSLMIGLVLGALAVAEPVSQVRPPPAGHYAVDLTGTLRADTLAQIDRVAGQLSSSGGGQIGVAFLNDAAGQDPLALATGIFNRWGVGHGGRDDGALILVAYGDRKMAIALGSGVDSDGNVAVTDRIVSQVMAPRFRAGDPDGAVLAAVREVAALLGGGGTDISPALPAEPQLDPDAIPPTFEGVRLDRSRESWVLDVDDQLPDGLERALNELSWDLQSDGRRPIAFVLYDAMKHPLSAGHLAGFIRARWGLRDDVWIVSAARHPGRVAISGPAEFRRQYPQDLSELTARFAAAVDAPLEGSAEGTELWRMADVLRKVERTGRLEHGLGERLERAARKSAQAVGATLVALVAGLGFAFSAWNRRRPRRCDGCGLVRQRLDEQWDDVHLTAGQKTEEKVGSVDYDVWWCGRCHDALVLRYGRFFSGYARCASCDHVTARHTTRTLVHATYDHGGMVEVNEHCQHCGYDRTYTRHTSRLTRSSSSSSSFGSSSRSSSSSFGGGRSSGRGSSGGW